MRKSLSLMVLVALSGLASSLLVACKAGTPTGMESKVITEVKQKVTIGGKDDKPPFPLDEKAAKEGGEHFQHHCEICHGLDGHNTGVPFAAKMDPPVLDLADKDVQGYTDGQLHWIIMNGVSPSGMPGWKGILEEDEAWHIVAYIRHLPPKGSLGAPAVFKEAEEEHEQMGGHMEHDHTTTTPPPEHHHH